MISGRWINS